MDLRRFALLTSLAVALVGFAVAVELAIVTTNMEHASAGIRQAAEGIDAAHGIEAGVLSHSRESLLLALTGDESHRLKRDKAVTATIEQLERARGYISSVEEQALLDELARSIPDYFAFRSQIETADRNVSEQSRLGAERVDAITRTAKGLIQLNLADASDLESDIASASRASDTLAYSSILLLGVGLPLLLFVLRRKVYLPLLGTISCLRAFRKGQQHPLQLSGLREMKEMAETVEGMIQDLQLAHQRQMQYLAAVAHDIRNPLGALKMAAELGLETKDIDDVRVFFDVISRQTSYLDQMVSDLLDTTRLESGQLVLQTEIRDINQVVEDAVALFQGYSKQHPITFASTCQRLLCPIDPLRVSQVLNNLISNAIKYSPNGGEVKIETRATEKMAVITVTDRGMGMTDDEILGIFVPFRRTKRTEQEIPGVGLGLFTAKRIVESHGGTIAVKSQPGSGTSFAVSLPGIQDLA